MNRSLALLRDWAQARSQSDPDESARPSWEQIHDEVDAYLAREEAPAQQGPDLFGGQG